MKQIFNYSILLFSLFLIACNHDNYNDKKLDDFTESIDSLIQLNNPRIFNGVILITQNGKTKYSKAFGYANFKDKIPIRIDDHFRIQSNSKQVTAVLILKEVEKGNIELEQTIDKYLPDFKQSWADSVSIHQLLNMSSGIVNADKPLIFKPGTQYKYSNAAYGILGRILEKTTGENYVDLANKLFKTLELANTYCYEFDSDPKGLVNGYIKTKEGYALDDFYERGITPEGWLNFIPAGGIISNAKDLHIWDTQLHSGKIVKPKSYEQMINYNIKGQHAAFGTEEIGYGYGLRIDESKAVKIIGHAGKGLGFANIKFYIPEKDLQVIILENVYDEDPGIVYYFENKLLELIIASSLVE